MYVVSLTTGEGDDLSAMTNKACITAPNQKVNMKSRMLMQRLIPHPSTRATAIGGKMMARIARQQISAGLFNRGSSTIVTCCIVVSDGSV